MTEPHEVDLHPAIRAWGDRIAALSADLPDLAEPIGPRRRAAALAISDALATWSTAPVPPGVHIEDVEIDGPGGPLLLRRFLPVGLPHRAPTQLFLHGGGFFAGTVREILGDRLCAARALHAGIQVLSLEYRLAPEHRYPAAVDDTLAALHALHADRTLGADRRRIGLGGNSAGAAIAASAAIAARDAGGPQPMHLDLEVVPGALAPVGDSARDYATGFGLDDAESLVEVYVGAGAVPEGASPLDVDDLSGLPPTLVTVAEHDPLRDSGLALATRLREAGVPTRVLRGLGHLHGTIGLTAILPAAERLQRVHALALAAAYGTHQAPAGAATLEGDDDVP